MASGFALSSFKTGVQLQRIKGGARPDSLMDLVNGDLDSAGAPVARDGTVVRKEFPIGQTKGLMVHNGRRMVFSDHPLTGFDPGTGYHVQVLRHPTNPSATLIDIYHARPFLGFPFVVAGFSDGSTWAYWLEEAGDWSALAVKMIGDMVQPTAGDDLTGYTYRAGRLNPADPYWAAGMAVAVGQVYEPTKYNGYKYEVTEVTGTSTTTGDTEPTWTAADGAVVYEDVDLSGFTDSVTPGANDPNPTTGTGTGTGTRYPTGKSGSDL